MTLLDAIDALVAHVPDDQVVEYGSERRTRFDDLDRAVWVEASKLGLDGKLPPEPGLGFTHLPGQPMVSGDFVPMSVGWWRNRLLALRALAEQATTTPAGGNDKHPAENGPIDPDGFAWGGTVYRGLRQKAFLALKYLWGSRHRRTSASDLAEPVWGDRELEPDKNQLGGIRRDINNFLRKHKVPLHAEVKAIDGLPYLSLLDGPPDDLPEAKPRQRVRRR